jgi:hypothetical protein
MVEEEGLILIRPDAVREHDKPPEHVALDNEKGECNDNTEGEAYRERAHGNIAYPMILSPTSSSNTVRTTAAGNAARPIPSRHHLVHVIAKPIIAPTQRCAKSL